MPKQPTMIEAAAAPETIRRVYDLWSHFYRWAAEPFERKPRRIGLQRAAIQPSDRVLEVAVGPGANFVEILKSVEPSNNVCGIDLSPKMLARTRKRARRAGFENFELQEADARHLPYEDGAFDVLYNSFMLDLIRLSDMPIVLAEFYRVLKPGGRLLLVNLSKPEADQRSWLEWLYQSLPRWCVPYVLGGCRPVVMERHVHEAGFVEVSREFVPNVMPAEVVSARKPA